MTTTAHVDAEVAQRLARDVSDRAAVVWLVAWTCHGHVVPRLELLATLSARSERTVTRARAELLRLGWFVRDPSPYSSWRHADRYAFLAVVPPAGKVASSVRRAAGSPTNVASRSRTSRR